MSMSSKRPSFDKQGNLVWDSSQQPPGTASEEDFEELPSHHCLILDKSFEALKSARSSTDAMRKTNRTLSMLVHTETEKSEEYDAEVHGGKDFLYKAEKDSMLSCIRERNEGGRVGKCSAEDTTQGEVEIRRDEIDCGGRGEPQAQGCLDNISESEEGDYSMQENTEEPKITLLDE